MGFFRKKKQPHTFDDIASVVILEHTQLYKQSVNRGVVWGGEGLFDNRVITMGGIVVNTDQSINRVVVYFAFLAMLDSKLQHFYLLGAAFNVAIENNSFKEIKTIVFGR